MWLVPRRLSSRGRCEEAIELSSLLVWRSVGGAWGECKRRLWARMEDEGSVEESVWLQGPLIVLCGDASQAVEGRGGDQSGLLPLDMNCLGTFVSCISPFCFKCVIFTLPRNLSLQRFHSKLVVLNPGCAGRSILRAMGRCEMT